jgi:serine/threonine protein kinase
VLLTTAYRLGYADRKGAFHFKLQYFERQERLPEVYVWNIVTQLNGALAFLHTGYGTSEFNDGWKAILHRDVKDSNILLSTVPGSVLPHARLTDFGFARVVVNADFNYTQKRYGQMWFYSPEHAVASKAGDMWASGCTIHTLCLHELPVDA